jgi:hypothetical protein
MALILRKLVQVVKHDESGVHRLSDVVGQGESPAYLAPDVDKAHAFVQQANGSRNNVRPITPPSVKGNGRRIPCPIEG